MRNKIILFAAVDTEFTKKEAVSLQVSFYHNHKLLEKCIEVSMYQIEVHRPSSVHILSS